jgi:hypothetical protein
MPGLMTLREGFGAARPPSGARKGESEEESNGASSRPCGPAEGPLRGWTPNMVLDDGGDATKILHDSHPTSWRGSAALGRDDDRGQPALARASLCNQSVRAMVTEINPICGPASGDGGLSGDDDERCRRTGPPGLILARVALSH